MQQVVRVNITVVRTERIVGVQLTESTTLRDGCWLPMIPYFLGHLTSWLLGLSHGARRQHLSAKYGKLLAYDCELISAWTPEAHTLNA
ncbi:hypothetical protein RB195_018112 [Necator americanus]|uniref:Uncharacterized protein n=1 Tax=Necator americanus TaxID=51031 RepID=A0ABR1C879_NECAM